jgi:hypothetical protein
VQNTLNLNREPANGSGLDTLDIVAFTAAVAVATITVDVIFRVRLTALSLSLLDILGLSFYSIIKDS